MTFGNVGETCSMETEIIEDQIRKKLHTLLKEGTQVPADEDKEDLELPPYYDAKKFKFAQICFHNNLFTMMIAKLSGLLTLLAIPSILDILIFTKQSGTPCAAFRRYFSTILHTFIWYEKDPLEAKEFFNSLRTVRRKHCSASRKCSSSGLRRITQTDMAITQFGFIGFTLMSAEQLGVKATEEELEGIVHFWRVIGYMLGMEEKYNLCTGTVEECRILCRLLLNEVFIPLFEKGNEKFDDMGRILIEAMWPLIPFLDPKAFTAFTLQLATSATINNNHSIVNETSSLPFRSKLLLNLQLNVHKYLMPTQYWWSSIFRAIFNYFLRLAIYLTENYPILLYTTYGKKAIVKFHNE
ncbi:uncharacterized protein LOC122506822 [Leptopilina heterotoma]|uniref:uncharacterized protein LOC122506822 n=1 Tax=Leptopilina heterotoma TaxID=63436 RepID=UPI001CA992A7|nr:uncharacterized protein LOC122506822 [Leptopilina heterotoma]